MEIAVAVLVLVLVFDQCFLAQIKIYGVIVSSSGRGSTRRSRWRCARPPPASSRSAASAARSSSPTPCSTSPPGRSKFSLLCSSRSWLSLN